MTHHCILQWGHYPLASQLIGLAHDARETVALQYHKSPETTPLAPLPNKRETVKEQDKTIVPGAVVLYEVQCMFHNSEMSQREQTQFRVVSLLRWSILDFQSPLPCCLLPPAVSCHEFPLTKSLGGVVKRPKKTSHYHDTLLLRLLLLLQLLLLLLILPLPMLLLLLQLLLLLLLLLFLQLLLLWLILLFYIFYYYYYYYYCYCCHYL